MTGLDVGLDGHKHLWVAGFCARCGDLRDPCCDLHDVEWTCTYEEHCCEYCPALEGDGE